MRDDSSHVLLTYKYLRVTMSAPAVLLLGTMIIDAGSSGWHVETSISGYYGTTVRDVFVGAMIATALCMIVYQGTSRLEDYSLNLMGFFAVFVALVPTNLAETLASLPEGDRTTLLQGLRGSLWAALGTFLIFAIIDHKKVRSEFWRELFRESGSWTKAAVLLTTLVTVLLICLVLWRLFEHDAYAWIHNYAAVALVVCLGVAVASHGWPTKAASGDETVASINGGAGTGMYRLIVLLMVLAGIAFAVAKLALDWAHSVIAIEIAEIVLFYWFWSLETKRLFRRLPTPPPH